MLLEERVLRELDSEGVTALSVLREEHGSYVYAVVRILEAKGHIELDPRTKCYCITPAGRKALEGSP